MYENVNSISYINQIILDLLKNALFNVELPDAVLDLCSKDVWHDVYREASIHNVETLVFHSINNLPNYIQTKTEDIERRAKFTLKRMLLNKYLMAEQTNVIKLLQNNNIDYIIIKGTVISSFYPIPELRPLGDIDILIREKQLKAATDVLCENGYVFDHKHDFHVVVKKNYVIVELHDGVSRFPNNKVGALLSNKLKSVFENSQLFQLNQIEFLGPSPFDNALILLLHMQRHLNKGIGLRQLSDWLMFVKTNAQKDFWDETLPFLAQTGLMKFAAVVTKIGVIYLGLDSNLCSWCMDADNKTCDILLQEILSSGNMGNKRSNEDKASGYLTDGFEKEDGINYNKKDQLKVIIAKFNYSAKRDFPFLKKVPVLLPLMWIYIPVRYYFRMLMGKRPELDTSQLLKNISMKKNLYKELGIFQTKW